jgi:Domain of Unknown Function (DUF1080)
MFASRVTVGAIAGLALLLGFTHVETNGQEKKPGEKKVWTDVHDPSLPVDFKFQGEYVGDFEGSDQKIGCQVIALDKGRFQAVILSGGLPGAGWDGKHKSLADGKLVDGKVIFTTTEGKRQYMAKDPDKFSATAKFPPIAHTTCEGEIADGVFKGMLDGRKRSFKMTKIERKSPTMGMKPPAGAVVLFDGTGIDEWTGGRLDKNTGLLNTDGKDITSKKKFNNYSAHVEFMIPFVPGERGQGRGNSGFYQVRDYEIQILDSFGLEGKDNECGGIYLKVTPKLNMCLPPLVWQTYDVDFTNSMYGDNGKIAKKARTTVKLNGVVIHDDVEIPEPTGGSRNAKEFGTPGPVLLQGHNNPLQFRNIWVVEKR